MSGLSHDRFDLGDPGLFPHDIDLGSGRAGFVRTDRATLSDEPFLDHRWRTPDKVDAGLPLAELQAMAPEPPRLSFIWHTSFCSSTLLSTCLDWRGACLALKEPRILVILAALKRSGHPAAGALARSVFGLLGRRFDTDEQILIKPSNGANTLIAEAAALTQGRMLLLYSDCESFVLSMARQGRAGFAYVRERFMSLAADGHPAARWPAADLLRLTDLELAALVWRMQMDALEAASARLGGRARSLDHRLLRQDPVGVLGEVDDFLGLGIGGERIERVAAGPLLARDAKHPGQAFDARARAEERARLRAHLGADLSAVLRWMDDAFPSAPKLAQPLMADAQPRARPAEAAQSMTAA